MQNHCDNYLALSFVIIKAQKHFIKYITVILPLALPKNYIYEVPEALQSKIAFGLRVEVPLRNKLYAGIVAEIHDENLKLEYKTRKIISVLDKHPVISEKQHELWKWMSKYYGATMGDVMNVALPSGLKLSSETKIVASPIFDENYDGLNDEEYMVAEAVSIQNELTIDEIRKIVDKKTVYPIIKSLLDHGVVYVKEELKQAYKVKKQGFVKFTEYYQEDKDRVSEAFDLVTRSEKQTKALLAIVKLSINESEFSRKAITEMSGADLSAYRAMEKKGILELYEKEVSRLDKYTASKEDAMPPMSEAQVVAHQEIKEIFETKNQILLHGVTGSGKTRVYIELIKECLAEGKQVLYLLPEIALTTQIVGRLSVVFGDDIGLYHSKLNNHQRVEIWKACMEGKPIVLGARSSLFLPFKNLGLIIIDEEHDSSFKQTDPSPRYNGRDTAVYLGQLLKAKVLMGTATPSLETFYNVNNDKYGRVSLLERFGNIELPEIQVVDLKYQYKTGRMKEHLSKPLMEAIEVALGNGEQVLLFQNRRGFSPTMQCTLCDWHAECSNCDVSLTYHQYFQELRCHYCSYRTKIPKSCPACGCDEIVKRGFGTEKIEHVINEFFPSAKVARMDYDTAKTRNAMESIIHKFETHEIDILVGTQMITKGLDFDNIGLVGIMNADTMIHFPDFRAHERAFQLFTQVAGRAGRKKKKGLVILQTFQPGHPIIQETVSYDFQRFYTREMIERKRFIYPPFFRLIEITLKHKKPQTVREAAAYLAHGLKADLGNRVIGPAEPGINRIRGMYLQKILIKLEKKQSVIHGAKNTIQKLKSELVNAPGFKSVRVNIDVDPY